MQSEQAVEDQTMVYSTETPLHLHSRESDLSCTKLMTVTTAATMITMAAIVVHGMCGRANCHSAKLKARAYSYANPCKRRYSAVSKRFGHGPLRLHSCGCARSQSILNHLSTERNTEERTGRLGQAHAAGKLAATAQLHNTCQ